MDGATGLTIVGARQYDPDTGRFITLDPLLETGDPTQLNGYGYAGNNPVTHADPTGLRTDYNGDASDTAYSSGKAPVQNVTYPHPLDRHEAVCLHHQYLTPHDVDDRHAARIRAGAARHTYAPNTDYKAPVPDTSAPTSHHASKGFLHLPTYGKNGECLIDIACRLKQIGRGTAGLCLNGGGALNFNLGGEVCVQADKNGIFFSATGATPADNHLPADYSDSSFGLGGGVGLKLEISDAKTKDSLAGPFNFGEGSVDVAQGGYSWGKGAEGEDVHMGYGGGSLGVPGGSGGVSKTAVSRYIVDW